ncbi:MAG: M23 family metallopeptidase, partial [Pyrinomonadaceae bacterium]|nr:M23 family metallopeptidase [Pyrinomonadaceae bacterium]
MRNFVRGRFGLGHAAALVGGLLLAIISLSAIFGETAVVVASGGGGAAQDRPVNILPDGGGTMPALPLDEITDEQRAAIKVDLAASIERLEREGKLPPARPEVVALSWPLQKAASASDFAVDAISNFVDQNPAFPNQLQDWNCGMRTYDTSGGYNHAGIDIFTWPFGWKKLDDNSAEIVAAAPGTIILKSDGNFDRNCTFNSSNWNAVYVRHSDNSVAWYGHMKKNSLTTKPVGATVALGEKLGIVGSSGNSTGPHLHFELYNAAGQLQDAYQGACNTMNNFTWWAIQPAYDIPRVNNLMTHSAAMSFPTCPSTTEVVNEKSSFRSGQSVITAAYYRDQPGGVSTQYSIIQPNGAVFQSWSHASPQTYVASYWYWTRTLP